MFSCSPSVRRHLACVHVSLALFLLATATAIHASDLDKAQHCLESQQKLDGSFSNAFTIATSEQATAEALLALADDSNAHSEARAFLDALPIDSNPTEYLARRVIVGGAAPLVIQELLARQNSDGGFGSQSGVASSALDTALGLNALIKTRAADSIEVQRALTYLMNRRANGVWTDSSGRPDVALTLAAWRAIFPLRHSYVGITVALNESLDALNSVRSPRPSL